MCVRERDRQTDRQRKTHTRTEIDRKERQTDRQMTDRQTTNRQTDDKQTDRQRALLLPLTMSTYPRATLRTLI